MANGKRDGLLIAGGGLAGCLAALAMVKIRPEVPILLIEEEKNFGGSHSWTFFQRDIPGDDRWMIDPLVSHSWPAYYVAFPRHSRKLKAPFHCIRPEQVDRVMRETLRPEQYRLGAKIVSVRENSIVLQGGETIRMEGTIDAREPTGVSTIGTGWQKYFGREYIFAEPHRVDSPVLMDATVSQSDGLHFFQCLPFDETRMLVGEYSYSENSEIDPRAIGKRIDAYIARRGWVAKKKVREERSLTPVPMGTDCDEFLGDGGSWAAKIGTRGGFLHPTTGYSLPDAIQAALLLTDQPDFAGEELRDELQGHASVLWRKREFGRTLNQMLIRTAEPSERYKLFENFYKLDPALIGRFHSGQFGLFDRRRIMSGKPPPAKIQAGQRARAR
jgi:lycopene beta-cyclase